MSRDKLYRRTNYIEERQIEIIWEFSTAGSLKCYLTLDQVARNSPMWETHAFLIKNNVKMKLVHIWQRLWTWDKCGSKAHGNFIHIQFSFLGNFSNKRKTIFKIVIYWN